MPGQLISPLLGCSIKQVYILSAALRMRSDKSSKAHCSCFASSGVKPPLPPTPLIPSIL